MRHRIRRCIAGASICQQRIREECSPRLNAKRCGEQFIHVPALDDLTGGLDLEVLLRGVRDFSLAPCPHLRMAWRPSS